MRGRPTDELAEEVLEAIREIPDWQTSKWIFGTSYTSNFHKAIKRACERAGVTVFSSHKIGRHSFSTRLLNEGKSLKFLKEAGRWKTAKMPMTRYGHLEQSEINTEVKHMALRWRKKHQAGIAVSLLATQTKKA